MSGAIRQAVILVGGQGSRLGNLVADTPKPLLQVAGRPFVEYWLEFLAGGGVEEIILACGHMAEHFLDKYDQVRFGKASISCFVEDTPAGTGGALRLMADRLTNTFVLVNGDSFTAVDLNKLAGAFRQHAPDCLAALTLVRLVKAADRYGKVNCTDESIITGFGEKQVAAKGDLINAGVYFCDRRIVEHCRVPASLEQDVLPSLAAQGKVCGFVNSGGFIDIGTPDDYTRSQTIIPELIVQSK